MLFLIIFIPLQILDIIFELCQTNFAYIYKEENTMATGKVKWFNNKMGYGLIAADSILQLFCFSYKACGAN